MGSNPRIENWSTTRLTFLMGTGLDTSLKSPELVKTMRNHDRSYLSGTGVGFEYQMAHYFETTSVSF